MLKNAVATARKVKAFIAAKMDLWESHWSFDRSKKRDHRDAKRAHRRAVRRSEPSHIKDHQDQ